MDVSFVRWQKAGLSVVLLLVAACGGGGGSSPTSTVSPPPAKSYAVKGTVSGLSGTGLVLLDNAGDALSVTASGAFTFATSVTSGASYAVTVGTQPSTPAQLCTVANGAGTVGSADVTSVAIQCENILTLDNSGDIARLGDRSVEQLLQVSSFVGDRLTYLAAHLAPSVTEQCSSAARPHAGTATYTFTDSDASGTLSPGDSVTIVLDDCESSSLGDYVTSSLSLVLGAAPQPANYDFGFTAAADLKGFQLLGLQLTGSLQVTYAASDTSRLVQAAVAAPGLLMHATGEGFFVADDVTMKTVNASKSIDYVTAQYSVDLAAQFSSVRLNGTFAFSTPETLTGPVNIYPIAGTQEFHGGPATLRFVAQKIAANQDILASLDADGSGKFVTFDPPQFVWEGQFTGFPWWEPRGGSTHFQYGLQQSPTYQTSQFNVFGAGLLFAEPDLDPVNQIVGKNLDVNAPLKFFFGAPVDATRSALIYVPRTPGSLGLVSIPAHLNVNGAMVTVTPQTQLEHGFGYELQTVDKIYPLAATALPGGVTRDLTTDNNLQADAAASPGVASPGQTVLLNSTRSFSTNSNIVAYSWQQKSGPAVSLAGVGTATASFSVPAGAVDGDSLVFGLTVTDATGETDSTTVTAKVLTDLTQPFLFYRQAQGTLGGFAVEDATLSTSVGGPALTELAITPGSPSNFQYFPQPYNAAFGARLSLPFGSLLVPGSYSGPSLGTDGAVEISVDGAPFVCQSPAWQITVIESVAASDGSASKFAADFSEQCPGGLPPLFGSVRVNSSVPLP
jgi:hypothetical protein